MQSTSKYTIHIMLLLLFLMSCQQQLDSEKAVFKYLNDADNGLKVTQKLANLYFHMKYLPKDVVKSRLLVSDNTLSKDSVDKMYSDIVCFMLTIELNQEIDPNSNMLFYGVKNMEEFKERINQLNFQMQNYLELHTNNEVYIPAHTVMEDMYNLGNKRNMLIFFKTKEGITEDIDLMFNDLIFKTGINHFVFERNDIKNIPEINLKS